MDLDKNIKCINILRILEETGWSGKIFINNGLTFLKHFVKIIDPVSKNFNNRQDKQNENQTKTYQNHNCEKSMVKRIF